jgi:flagellar hook-length control protein FliK
MIIRLKPDFLGHVKLHVSTENQQVTVRMEAESAVVKDIIEQHMPHLKAELHQHGLHIEKFDVFVGNQNDGWQNGQHPTGFRQASKRNGQSPAGNQAEDEPYDRSEESGGRSLELRGYRSSEVDYFA